MGLFKSKNELEEKIEKLYLKNNELSEQIEVLRYENRILREKIESTSDCDYCYTTLQRDYKYCPNCGRSINRTQDSEKPVTKFNIFETEDDLDGVLITKYIGFHDRKIVIPSSINGKPVIGIWNDVFNNCKNLTEVYFEDGCKYIGAHAFANCGILKKVRLPKSLLEIGNSAFAGTALEDVAVPPRVKVIGSNAFACKTLKNIILPESLKYISNAMLAETAIERIQIPESVTYIDSFAFYNSNLKVIDLPKKLYAIGPHAFDCPNLKKVTIHSNVKAIQSNSFSMKNKPQIYCARGSKGQLYARKYNFDYFEIPEHPVVESEKCVAYMIIQMGTLRQNEKLCEWYKYFDGVYKAETWSWKQGSNLYLQINKMMGMNEAKRLEKKFRDFILNHKNIGSLAHIYIAETSDQSDV